MHKSKHNHTLKNQVVLLMITDGGKWHYTALKSESTEDGFYRPILMPTEKKKKNLKYSDSMK